MHAQTPTLIHTHTEIHRCTSYYQNTPTAAHQHQLSPAPKKQPLNFFSQTFFIFSHFLYLPQFLNLDDNRHLRLFFSEPLKCFFFLFSTLRKNFQKELGQVSSNPRLCGPRCSRVPKSWLKPKLESNSSFLLNALPQAVRLGIFIGISAYVVAPFQGTWIKEALLREERREKSPAPSRIWTHNSSVTRHALFRCATTSAQEFKNFTIVDDLELKKLFKTKRE